MTQRRIVIRSRKYLDGSRGQPCTLQITGVCNGDWSTTVAAHVRDESFGMAQKADDISVVDACAACHDCFDGRHYAPLSKEEWEFYARRGLQRTLRNRVERGIVIVPLDAERLSSERPALKPKAERKPSRPIPHRPMQNNGRPIPQPADPWGKSRKAKAKAEARS